jgi:hypothetical protein
MTVGGFPLPDSNWYFTQSYVDQRWYIRIHHGGQLVVDVKASNEQLVCKRAWDALREYCFRGTRTIQGVN